MSEVLAKEKAEAKGAALKYGGYDKPIRICLKLGKYTLLSAPFVYGLDSNAYKGIAMTRKEFKAISSTTRCRTRLRAEASSASGK